MLMMKGLRSPLLHIHGDKELAQIAAARNLPLSLFIYIYNTDFYLFIVHFGLWVWNL